MTQPQVVSRSLQSQKAPTQDRHKRYEKMTQRCGTHSPKAVVFRYTRQWSNLICSSCMHFRVRGPRTNHEAAKGQRIFKLKKRGAGWSKHPILKRTARPGRVSRHYHQAKGVKALRAKSLRMHFWMWAIFRFRQLIFWCPLDLSTILNNTLTSEACSPLGQCRKQFLCTTIPSASSLESDHCDLVSRVSWCHDVRWRLSHVRQDREAANPTWNPYEWTCASCAKLSSTAPRPDVTHRIIGRGCTAPSKCEELVEILRLTFRYTSRMKSIVLEEC